MLYKSFMQKEINKINREYKTCKVCNCSDCKIGTFDRESWYCPILKKQTCDICCLDTILELKLKCQSIKCIHYNN